MASEEYERFVWKFRQLWSPEARAGISFNCEEGHVRVNLSVDLGPGGTHFPHPRVISTKLKNYT